MDVKKFIKGNQEYFEDYITRATYHSNGIEGSTLSMAETYAIIFNQKNVKVTAEPRELYEAINHKYGLDYILNNMGDSLAENDIIKLAQIINKNIDEIDGYRKTQVFIKGAEHIPSAPNLLKQQMMYFVYNYNNTIYNNVFEKIAVNHIEYERIHPFSDGNGRTGRLIMWYELIKNNLAPAVITMENKLEYINFIASGDGKSLANMIRRLSQEENERMKIFSDK